MIIKKELFLEVYIHSVIFVVIGTLGIICSWLLYTGLKRKSTLSIIWWIVYQGIALFHQIFFSFEIIIILSYRMHNSVLVLVVAFFLSAYIILQAYFIKFIVEIYQTFVEQEISTVPRSTWRVPTISELLGDESVMGETLPPYNTLRFDGNRGTSDA